MRGILVDSNVILDVFLDDPNRAEWSESKLAKLSLITKLSTSLLLTVQAHYQVVHSKNIFTMQ